MLFSLLKHYLEVYVTDIALKVSRSLHCFNTPVSHGVENYFFRLWGMGISDTIFKCPARDACLCMGELLAPPAPHFVFLITL